MPKKRFEERPYDPISADLVRDVTAAKTLGERARTLSAQTPMALISARSEPIMQPFGQVEPTITKRFVLSRSEDAEMNGFLLRLQQSARSKITLSVLVRAALAVVMEAESRLCDDAGKQIFRLPSTHDRLALSEFEDQWRRSLQAALLR